MACPSKNLTFSIVGFLVESVISVIDNMNTTTDIKAEIKDRTEIKKNNKTDHSSDCVTTNQTTRAINCIWSKLNTSFICIVSPK